MRTEIRGCTSFLGVHRRYVIRNECVRQWREHFCLCLPLPHTRSLPMCSGAHVLCGNWCYRALARWRQALRRGSLWHGSCTYASVGIGIIMIVESVRSTEMFLCLPV